MKKAILDEAVRLIQRYGLKRFKVDDIAAELKISKRTIYQHFSGKDEIIQEYFSTAVTSDKNSVLETLDSQKDIVDKIHEIVYSDHRYKLPVLVLSEAKKFYPNEWAKIEELKQFKLDALKKLLEQGSHEGMVKSDIHFGVLSKMLEEISNMFTDYDFLLDNKLKTTEAIEEALRIIFDGVLKESK